MQSVEVMDCTVSANAGDLLLARSGWFGFFLALPLIDAEPTCRANSFQLFHQRSIHALREVVIKCKNLGRAFLNP